LNRRPQYLLEKFEDGYRVRLSTQEDLDRGRENCRCDQCSVADSFSPILHDSEWNRLADEKERLCFPCLINRAKAKGVRLSLESLRPCAFNLLNPLPWPWFYAFALIAGRPPQNIDEWREARQGAEAWSDLYEPDFDPELKDTACYKWLEPIPAPSTLEEFFKDAPLRT
jgi:hypothetical protein